MINTLILNTVSEEGFSIRRKIEIFIFIKRSHVESLGLKLKDREEVSILYGEDTYVILPNFSFMPCCMNYVCMI